MTCKCNTNNICLAATTTPTKITKPIGDWICYLNNKPGTTGPTGPQGPIGPTGPQGPAGVCPCSTCLPMGQAAAFKVKGGVAPVQLDVPANSEVLIPFDYYYTVTKMPDMIINPDNNLYLRPPTTEKCAYQYFMQFNLNFTPDPDVADPPEIKVTWNNILNSTETICQKETCVKVYAFMTDGVGPTGAGVIMKYYVVNPTTIPMTVTLETGTQLVATRVNKWTIA